MTLYSYTLLQIGSTDRSAVLPKSVQPLLVSPKQRVRQAVGDRRMVFAGDGDHRIIFEIFIFI